MFRLWCSENKLRVALCHFVLALLCLVFTQTALGQGGPDIAWQADSAGVVLAYSADGQMLLAGTQLFAAKDGTFIRSFHRSVEASHNTATERRDYNG